MDDLAAGGLAFFAAVADLIDDSAPAMPQPPGASTDPESAPGSPCSVTSDCSSVATADLEGFADLGSALVLDDLVSSAASTSASASLPASGPRAAAPARSVFALDCVPRWGLQSVCGRRLEMEDAARVLPAFFHAPLWMLAGDAPVDGLDRASFRLPTHFFGVYDGHGGLQVANYCRERIHEVLAEELTKAQQDADLGGLDPSTQKHWEKAFVDCFSRVDAEVGGNEVTQGKPVAPDTVGSTAVVALVCSTSSLPIAATRGRCSAGASSLWRCPWTINQTGKMSMRGLRPRGARSSIGMAIEFSVFLPCPGLLVTDT